MIDAQTQKTANINSQMRDDIAALQLEVACLREKLRQRDLLLSGIRRMTTEPIE